VITEKEQISILISKLGNPIRPRQPPAVRNSIHRLLMQVESLLYIDTTRIKLKIGKMVVRNLDHNVPEIFANADNETTLFELVDQHHRCIGEIWTTREIVAKAGFKPLNFITISWGGLFAAVRVTQYYYPFWIEPGQRTKRFATLKRQPSDSLNPVRTNSSLFRKNRKNKRLDLNRSLTGSYWDVANVLPVEKVGEVWRRVAVGKVVIPAWFEVERENGWVVLA